MEANHDEKEWTVLLKFRNRTASENFNSSYGPDSNKVLISIWHKQQDRLERKVSYTRRKFQSFMFITDLPYYSKNL